MWTVHSLVIRARGREFESRSLHLKPETKLCEERGLSGCRKGFKTVPLAQSLLSLKPAKNNKQCFNNFLASNEESKDKHANERRKQTFKHKSHSPLND